ncbi:transketolase [Alkalibacter mobilis]|uniref:transketolase n=1 Tax=Alkalibacter mobilis TaxID=2787712 RepID=UPI00189D3599|nr:transketolase [Alkalibacter mobilis]MBF7097299.1 transketolase [Alkalibacter mobilis]
MISNKRIKKLEIFATEIRLETMKAFAKLGFGHVGGAMSIVDTLSVLYGEIMKIDPANPKWPDRDWLVVSKGHAGPSVYSALAIKGYFDKKELLTLNMPGTNLPSHCDRNKTVGIDMTTGSLGQGISTAIGVALGNRMDKRDNYTYLILGDGECDEGQIWEGALFAAHQKLDNLISFVDYNKKQLDGMTCEINDLGDLDAKFHEFGWHAQRIDGHDIAAIYEAIDEAKKTKGKPSMIVLDTIKGKGCCFVEEMYFNHHITISQEQSKRTLSELENRYTDLKREWEDMQ